MLPCIALLMVGSAHAQVPAMAGTWVLSTPRGDSLTLTFEKDSAGITRGRVMSKDEQIDLAGRRRAGGLAGPTTSAKGAGYFSAAIRGQELDLVLAAVNGHGAPMFDTARQFVLTRRAAPVDSITRNRTPH